MYRRGFTMIELMIATAIAIVGIAAAFAFARTQIRGFATQDEVARMQSSAQLVLEALARDIRNAGFGTSFYAGMPSGGLGGGVAVIDGGGQSRGFPAIRVANSIGAPANVMPGSDAITLLRTMGETVILQTEIPCDPGTAAAFLVETGTLPNLNACIASGGLVLVSDSSRPTGEPESMLLSISPASAADQIQFQNAWGIDPSAAARCTNGSNPPSGVGVGSFAVCVQPVTYWIDNNARLRMWRPLTGLEIAAAVLATGAGGTRVPINPAADLVVAEGIEDLQFAIYLSAQSGLGGPTWLYDGSGAAIADLGQLAESRIVRISAIARTTRQFGESYQHREGLLGPGNRLEDHVLPAAPVRGCTDPTTCYDPLFNRKLVVVQAELRNMRIFDVLSSSTRTWNDMRSYRP